MSGPVGDRDISNIYIADYDGAQQQRVTITKSLNITPVWSPDGRSIAFSSWRTSFQDIRARTLTTGPSCRTRPRAPRPSRTTCRPGRPTASKLAFTSNRDGNPEIYVMNRDGSGLRRLTNIPTIDVTPTWSPTGNADRVHVGPHRHAADLHHERRRHRPAADHPRDATAIARPGRRRRSTRSPTPSQLGRRLRHQGLRFRDRAARARSPTASAATRARRSRPTAGTSRSRRRATARSRSSRSTATARTCGRSRGTGTTGIRTGRNSRTDERDNGAIHREMTMRQRQLTIVVIAVVIASLAARARKKKPPVARPMPPPPRPRTDDATRRRRRRRRCREPTPMPPEPIAERSAVGARHRRHQQELAVPAGVLRSRQLRGRRDRRSRR